MFKLTFWKRYSVFGILLLGALAFLRATPPVWAAASQARQPNAPVTDLLVDRMEIIQSIQDLNNSVPLVAGKRTFVRLYAHATTGSHLTLATLKVDTGLLSKTLLPIKPGGPLITVKSAYNRLLPSHAFLFELPNWATVAGNLTLTATVNPDLRWRPRSPEEFSYANNVLVQNASFDLVSKLHLVIVDQPYRINNLTYSVRPYDRWKAVEWIARAYPLSQVKVYFRTLPVIQAQRKLDENGKWVLTYPSCTWLNLYLALNRATIFGNPFIPATATFLGIVPDDMGFMRGCAPINGMLTSTGYTRVASGPVGSGDWGWDFDGSYADWYSGHEVGHAWSRPHVRGGPGYVEDGCGGEAKSYVHYPDGSISPSGDIFNLATITGFDSLRLAQGQNPILSPYWSDMMTYCDYLWISKITYQKLMEMFIAYLPSGQETPVAPATQPALTVFGELHPSSGVTLLPVFGIASQAALTPPDPGPYAIVLRDSGGGELARYPFSPNELEPGPAPFEGYEEEVASFALLLPPQAGITSLQLEGPGGTVLQEIEAGLNPPWVQVLSPNGGEIFDDQPVTVSWSAGDLDGGDTLTFQVEYSADNGASWEPVAQFVSGNQVAIDPVNLPGSDLALFRVTASDGLHSTADQSDTVFFIPNHLPGGEIVAPTSGATLALDQTVNFQAQVYDNDLGFLDDGELEWVSDRDGVLGYGANLSIPSLTVGLHEVNLFAYDGYGQTWIGQVIVNVVSTPDDLPPEADGLVVGPDLVFLFPAAGTSSGVIAVDNLNQGNSIAWQVSSDKAWVNLSATSGSTPQEITVSTSLTGHDYGTHKALLTFSDPFGNQAYVVVSAEVGKFQVYLPVTQR